MKIVFSGFERATEVAPGVPSVLQIESPSLFARVCQSFKSGEGRYAVEPYTVWEGEEEVDFRKASLFVESPLSLPWDDKALAGGVMKRFEKEYLADEDLRGEMESVQARLSSLLLGLGAGLNVDYDFAVEWSIAKYMKAFGFGAPHGYGESILDSLIEFLSLILDSGCDKVLVFANLKTFLSENEIQRLYEHAFFCKAKMLLVENKRDGAVYQGEAKHIVDLHFLES